MAKYELNESYLHRFAKNLLARELREQNDTRDYCYTNSFCWRSNYGVFTELPFYETSNVFYFELSEGLLPDFGERTGDDPLLWFDNKFDRGKILFVPDITIFHKGQAYILIEVVHTNGLTKEKIKRINNFFDGYHFELFEVSAYHILSRTTNNDVKFKRVI